MLHCSAKTHFSKVSLEDNVSFLVTKRRTPTGKPDKHPQHPPNQDLLQNRKRTVGYVTKVLL